MPSESNPVQGVGVGVTDARRLDLHQDFAGLGAFQVQLDNLKRLLGFERDGGAGLHGRSPKWMRWRAAAGRRVGSGY
jgi:hypothetical protein